ncbi:MAG: tyrosine recombinase XerD [Clostridiales bacterium]|uniref:site-specific tyrosine recombinase n=1 Tax=Clostridium sp. N3C TaxID=1776758 RepID=UPI00092DF432|nr:site-specific tyrosine recombinase [Clostridium sp. N3C]NLZ47690.1 tyrosine recombinase XerD [Clostridiales bacterium]SCN21396.1 Tyrosine recombinase XerD [Clostridium sp. N3C]
MNELINKYLTYISEDKRLSSNTIDAYRRDISRFDKFLQYNNVTFEEVNKITIMNYIDNLSQKGKKQSSIARNVICLRNFYKFLLKKGYIDHTPVIDYEIPKYKRNTPEILTIDEVNRLLSMPDTNTVKGIRDKAMLEMMYATGIKVTEMLNLTESDIDLRYKYLKCKGTKGMERIIPLGSYCVECMDKYLKVREELNVDGLDYLFLNNRGGRMTRQGFWKIIKYYGNKANINKEINLYTLRHSIAVHLIENGADMRSLKELLGYKDISAVQMYVEVIEKRKLMEVYKNTHPRA